MFFSLSLLPEKKLNEIRTTARTSLFGEVLTCFAMSKSLLTKEGKIFCQVLNTSRNENIDVTVNKICSTGRGNRKREGRKIYCAEILQDLKGMEGKERKNVKEKRDYL